MSELEAALERASLMSNERTLDGAHARMDTHEAVCAERYKGIINSLNEVKAMLLTQASDTHERLNTISSRMWVAVTGVLGVTVVGLGTLVFYLLTRGTR